MLSSRRNMKLARGSSAVIFNAVLPLARLPVLSRSTTKSRAGRRRCTMQTGRETRSPFNKNLSAFRAGACWRSLQNFNRQHPFPTEARGRLAHPSELLLGLGAYLLPWDFEKCRGSKPNSTRRRPPLLQKVSTGSRRPSLRYSWVGVALFARSGSLPSSLALLASAAVPRRNDKAYCSCVSFPGSSAT